MYVYEVIDGDYEIYKNLSTAFKDAVKLLIEYNEANRDKSWWDSERQAEAWTQLCSSYVDPKYTGFYVDDIVYCYEAKYHDE